ncbi:hypothetical protein LJ656_02525 [Paraburkholderia sp. MMS20-SJTR3]|uniref:BceP n=1 Tax=Paraburkholderia sejongensis TaxID=2886946 RepID=A0ABS8JNX9_9BURK|nr:hypothetical protein [Paraburkholderia sp. MMS20-SJTR3]MCC8391449.1 hypothetical protein [Paraburkholderia sp. MMS20-SJTR3]
MPRVTSTRWLAISACAAAVTVASLCAVAPARAQTALPATTSWLGNSSGFGDGTWTQINITALAVSPDGKVYTNAPWDESGAEASVYQDGKMLGFAGGTHGWGNSGGNAIAINRKYVFVALGVGNEKGRLAGQGIWPEKGRQWFGISRRLISDPKRVAPFQPAASAADPHAQLAAGFLMTNDVPTGTDAALGGLAASATTLYAANTARNRIDVYDAESMLKKATWDVPEPGRIALAADGSLWVLTGTRGDGPPAIAHYTADGRRIDENFTLPAGTLAVDLATDAQGRVLIADNGPRQQVLFFSKRDGRYSESGTLGERGGIFSGVAGKPGPQRFNGLTGVGVDARGNVFVSTNGIGPRYAPLGAGLGATLESYAPSGKRNWQVQGLLFVDGAWLDPARPDSVYTGNKRFELDLSKPPGEDWKYVGFLSNRFKYPDDPVFHTDQYPGLPIARRVQGRTFLYLTDMYADHLKIYRFDPQHDGETAIPSGLIAGRERAVAQVPNAPPGGDWIWRDANGNGRIEPAEFAPNTSGTKLAGGWGWWVDTAGDIWRARDNKGLYRFRFGGLDAHGNPLYSYSNLTRYPVPPPFTELHRALYDPATDTLYATGYTADAPFERGFWKEVGRVLVRYDKWSSGTPVQRYAIALPWQPGAKPIATIIGVTVEGQYLFGVEPVGTVHVWDKDSGRELGVIRPGPEVGRASGWVDVPNGISAARRGNGEYLVFVEEDARGKVLMYRWKP